jgi:hypothetical protein
MAIKLTDHRNYWGISLLSTSYKILSNIPFSRLTPNADEITGNHKCGFKSNISTHHIFYTQQILEKNGSITVQCIGHSDFKKAYDSVRRKVLYNVLIQFGIPMKLVGLIKCVLKRPTSKNLSNKFPIQNGLKHRDAPFQL